MVDPASPADARGGRGVRACLGFTQPSFGRGKIKDGKVLLLSFSRQSYVHILRFFYQSKELGAGEEEEQTRWLGVLVGLGVVCKVMHAVHELACNKYVYKHTHTHIYIIIYITYYCNIYYYIYIYI
jgi:hypothetical protein